MAKKKTTKKTTKKKPVKKTADKQAKRCANIEKAQAEAGEHIFDYEVGRLTLNGLGDKLEVIARKYNIKAASLVIVMSHGLNEYHEKMTQLVAYREAYTNIAKAGKILMKNIADDIHRTQNNG